MQAKQSTRVRWVWPGLVRGCQPAACARSIPTTDRSIAAFPGASCDPGKGRRTPQGKAGDLGQLGAGCAGRGGKGWPRFRITPHVLQHAALSVPPSRPSKGKGHRSLDLQAHPRSLGLPPAPSELCASVSQLLTASAPTAAGSPAPFVVGALSVPPGTGRGRGWPSVTAARSRDCRPPLGGCWGPPQPRQGLWGWGGRKSPTVSFFFFF